MNKLLSKRVIITLFAITGITSLKAALTVVEGANIPIPATFGGVYIDLINPPTTLNPTQLGTADNAAGNYTISFSEPMGDWDFNFFLGGVGISHNFTANPYREDGSDNLSAIHALGIGEIVNGTTPSALGATPLATPGFGGSGTGSGGGSGVSTSGNHMGINPHQFTPGQKGYLGFVLDQGTPNESYGWMSVTFNDDGTPGLIHDFAFQDSPLAVAAIPEPTTSLLLLLTSLTVIRRRR